MIIQLDAAQLIELIDDDGSNIDKSRLRNLLTPHVCAISVSVLIDLRNKTDQPSERYHAALRGLKVIWGIDGGMICTIEAHRGFDRLRMAHNDFNELDKGFVFREKILDAINLRAGLEIPYEFQDWDFGVLCGNPIYRIFMKMVSECHGESFLKQWCDYLPEAVGETPPSLREILLLRARRTTNEFALIQIEKTSDSDLVKLFPANALMVALREINHKDGKRKYSKNDVVDLFHVPMSVYCDASFFDESTAGKVSRAQGLIGLQTTVVRNAQAIAFLESQKNHF